MNFTVIGIAILVVATAVLAVVEFQKRALFAKVEHFFEVEDYQAALDVLDTAMARVAFPTYNRQFMRLNALMSLERTEDATETIDGLLGLKMNRDQKLALYGKALMFFVEVEDRTRAERVLDLIRGLGDADLIEQSEQTVEIFLKGSSAYIDRMETALKTAREGGERMRLCQLLAVQYENAGNERRAEQYYDQVEHEMAKIEKAGR